MPTPNELSMEIRDLIAEATGSCANWREEEVAATEYAVILEKVNLLLNNEREKALAADLKCSCDALDAHMCENCKIRWQEEFGVR